MSPVKAESVCEEGVLKCNPSVYNLLQACTNCDSDSDNEWCNIADCANSNLFCVKDACQELKCFNSQYAGDVNDDGYISEQDSKMLNLALKENKILPEEKCCLDVNKDGAIDSGDVESIDNIIKNGLPETLGKCEIKEPGEGALAACNKDGTCSGEENEQNCPEDCKAAVQVKKLKINKYLLALPLLLIFIIVGLFIYYRKKKGNINNNPNIKI